VHRKAAVFEVVRAFDHILLSRNIHGHTSYDTRVIALTNKQTDKSTNRHY